MWERAECLAFEKVIGRIIMKRPGGGLRIPARGAEHTRGQTFHDGGSRGCNYIGNGSLPALIGLGTSIGTTKETANSGGTTYRRSATTALGEKSSLFTGSSICGQN